MASFVLSLVGFAVAAQEAALWDDLAGADAVRAHRAVWSLTAAGDRGVAFLKARLRPEQGSGLTMQQLIANLDHRRFAVRETASRELAKLGTAALPALRQTLRDTTSQEVRKRIEALLALALEVPLLARSADELRGIRGVQVLEYIGSRAAKELLGELASGATGTRLTEEARKALDRPKS